MATAQSMGVPIKLLHEGEGLTVTAEMKNGETYRGILLEAEETMNCQIKEVTMTARDGRISRLEHVFLRGGQIKYIVLPDSLKSSPVFKKVQALKAKKAPEPLRGTKSSRGRTGPKK